MVLVHFGENLSGYTPPIAGLGAPLFAFLSGASYFLWTKSSRARGKSELEISKISVRRGLFVFGVGLAFNILVWLPEDTFNWDVLTLIGVALLILNLARRLPLPPLILAAVISMLISPILRSLADYDSYWVNHYFDYDLTLSDVLIGFVTTGYFPFFPWITFSLAGFVAASLLFPEPSETDSSAPLPSTMPMMLLGATLFVAALIALYSRPWLPETLSDYLGDWEMFPPTLAYVLGMLGVCLLLFGALHQYVDRNPHAARHRAVLNIAKTFSQYSFTIYLLHHVIHIWPLWIYGLITQNDPTYFWMKAMPLTVSLPLALLFMACCYFMLRWIGPDRNYGIESWMHWLCD